MQPFPSEVSIGTQLFTALFVGLLIIFAFQCLLAILGLALGITTLQMGPHQSDSNAAEKADHPLISMSWLTGSSILLSVNSILFGACLLAVRFSQVQDATTGAITGIAIWSAYFLLLLWLSSRAVSSMAGSLLDAVTGGLRRLVKLVTRTIQDPSLEEGLNQADTIALIRQEVQLALQNGPMQQLLESQRQTLEQLATTHPLLAAHPTKISESETAGRSPTDPIAPERWQQLSTYFLESSPKSLTGKRIERKLQKLLDPEDPFKFNLESLTTLLNQRQDLSEKQRSRIIRQVEAVWPGSAQEQVSTTGQQDEAQESRSWSEPVVSILKPAAAKLSSSLVTQLGEQLMGEQLRTSLPSQIEPLLEKSVQQLQSVQQTVQDQLTDLKHQAQVRLEQTRQATAIAAWWLFATAFTAGLSAAAAGVLASQI